MKKLFSEIPYIQSDCVILKKLTEEDADALHELVILINENI